MQNIVLYKKISATIYFVAVLCITLLLPGRYTGRMNNSVINLNLFSAKLVYIKDFWKLQFNRQLFLVSEILGNLLLFVPAYLAVHVLLKKGCNLRAVFFVPGLLCCILAIEYLQLFFGIGTFDIDDVFLNFIGGVIGMVIIRMMDIFKSKRRNG